ALVSGSPESIALSASGLPSGATTSFAPASVSTGGSSTLTINAGSAAVGTYTVTVTGTSGSATHSTAVTLTVTPPNDFSIGASPTSLSLQQGHPARRSSDLALVSGSPQSIALSASGLPSGASASFAPGSVSTG